MTDPSKPSGAEPPIRVMLVDDHGVVRRGLRTFFELVPDIVESFDVDVDDVPQFALCKIGDPYGGDSIFNAYPLVILGIFQVFWKVHMT